MSEEKASDEFAPSGSRLDLQTQQPLVKIPKNVLFVVVGTGGPATPKSLLIATECSMYLFNCSEGTQRFLEMNKSIQDAGIGDRKLLQHIFITHKSWKNTGGLLGMVMTLKNLKDPVAYCYQRKKKARQNHSQNEPVMTIHGPTGVDCIANKVKAFSAFSSMKIVRHDGVFKDSALTITPIILYTTEPGSSTDELDSDICSPGPSKILKTESELKSDTAYAYVCMMQPVPQQINLLKSAEAGITMDQVMGHLQRGESVTLEDGTIVHPEEFTYLPDSDDKPVLIIECPREEFLQALRNKEFEMGLGGKDFSLIVHMTPAVIFHTTEYQDWLAGFHNGTNHLVMNEQASSMNVSHVQDHQAQLNLISSEVFPLLPNLEAPRSSFTKFVGQEQQRQIIFATSGMQYRYRSRDGVGFHIETEESNCTDIQRACRTLANVDAGLSTFQDVTSTLDATVDSNEECRYPKITFLGTGAAVPGILRAQSCILVQLSKQSAMVLDCGEESYGQMYRFFGKSKISRILRKIKAIFISHGHGDHHLGLFTFLKERKAAFDEENESFTPVFVSASIGMKKWLNFYDTEVEKMTDLFRFVRHEQSTPDEFYRSIQPATLEEMMKELNFTEVTDVLLLLFDIINSYLLNSQQHMKYLPSLPALCKHMEIRADLLRIKIQI